MGASVIDGSHNALNNQWTRNMGRNMYIILKYLYIKQFILDKMHIIYTHICNVYVKVEKGTFTYR